MIAITKGAIGGAVKVICKVVLYGSAIANCSNLTDNIIDKVRYSRNVKYSDAIDVIVNSNMLDNYKNEALGLVKKNEDTEYYKAIIKIVKSDMLGSNRLVAIANLNKGEEA
jgi:hypothetical protein